MNLSQPPWVALSVTKDLSVIKGREASNLSGLFVNKVH
jgi:hypothetical protein